jgi:predicted enzyme related to lactoylglutathione lyase
MKKGDPMMANAFVHIELNTTDPGKAKAFYGKLFDWQLTDMPMDGKTYTLIKVGEGTGGGIMQHPMSGQPSIWIPYVQVADLKAQTDKARALGGTIIKEMVEVKDMGTFSIVLDPTGAAVGLWEMKKA